MKWPLYPKCVAPMNGIFIPEMTGKDSVPAYLAITFKWPLYTCPLYKPKAYIPLPIIPTCWYPKSLVDPTGSQCKHIIPNATPNASRWNIGCIGSPRVGAHVGHVHFKLFVSISFALGSQRERGFQWNMDFKVDVGKYFNPNN